MQAVSANVHRGIRRVEYNMIGRDEETLKEMLVNGVAET